AVGTMATKSTTTTTTARTADVFDLYLAGLRELPQPLDRAGEVRAAKAIEEAERACLDLILDAGVTLPEIVQWADQFEAGEISLLELTQLGGYEGEDGRARLAKDLARARRAEKRYEELRQPHRRTRRSPAELRAARDKACRARADAVRHIGLHRERI